MMRHIENHIEKMRSKPEHIRKQYSMGVSLGITGVIFIFWLASFGIRTAPIAADTSVKPKPPFTLMAASAGDAAKGSVKYIKEIFFGANKTEYSSDNVEVIGGDK